MAKPNGTENDDAVSLVDFGTYLRRLRIAQNLSQSQLAERANMSVEGVSALERGVRKRPHASTVDILGAALGLDADDMHALREVARAVPRTSARGESTEPSANEAVSNEAVANNLPLQLTSFVGRTTEIGEIAEALHTHRVVTLVGPGGIGKTRTSQQVAAGRLGRARDGVWYVELAPLTTGEYVPTTIAHVLRTPSATGIDPIDDLVRALRRRSCLIVLDNCEHVIDAAASVVAAIVRGCPDVRVLASSRQPLGVAGEAVYRMPSLPLPTLAPGATRTLTAAEALASPAVRLFAERAAEADARFALTDDNAGTVAAICERLDGIPLAIELAAPRTKIFTPKQLLGKLDERFRFLAGDKRDGEPRQQTLRSLIDWSYDLLDDAERRVFRALGIFAGTFSLEAGIAVAAPDRDESEAVETLAALTDKSLVLVDDAGETKRFRLLETTRAYARDKLADAGEFDAAARLHLAYFRALFQESVARRERTGNGGGHERLFAVELDDVRIAVDFALADASAVRGAELLAAINNISWTRIGHGSEGLARLQAFRDALGTGEPALVARLCAWIAVLARELGQRDVAGEASTAAVRCARTAGDPGLLATALARHANTMVSLERLVEARAALDEAEAYPSPSAMQHRRILEARANLYRLTEDLDAAVLTWEAVLARLRAAGDAGDERVATVCLSECEFQRGNVVYAIELIERQRASMKTAADWSLYVRALCDLAAYRIAIGAWDAARAEAEEAKHIAAGRDVNTPSLLHALEISALLHATAGETERAARLVRFTSARLLRTGVRREYVAATVFDHVQRVLAGSGVDHVETDDEIATIDDALLQAH